MQDLVITTYHIEVTFHQSLVPTLDMMMKDTYFPGMMAKTREHIARCPGCVQKQSQHHDSRIQGGYFPRHRGYIGQHLFIDLAGPFPISTEGYQYILGMQDQYTGYTVTVPLKGKRHKEVALKIQE